MESKLSHKQLDAYKYQFVYDNLPIGIWEDDYSAVKRRLDKLSKPQKTKLKAYLINNPNLVKQLKASVVHSTVNCEALHQFGYQSNQSEIFLNHYPGYPDEAFIEEVTSLFHGQESQGQIVEETDKNGKTIFLFDTFHLPEIYQDTWQKVITISMDITEQVAKDKIIDQQLSQLQQASNIAKIGYWSTGPKIDDEIIFHGFFSEYFGLSAKGGTISRKEIYPFIHPEDKHRVLTANEFAYLHAVGFQIEYRLLSHTQAKLPTSDLSLK